MGAPKLDVQKDSVSEAIEQIRDKTFLSFLSDNLIELLPPIGRIQNIQTGLTVMVEGKSNDHLFFLLEGEVDVSVAGEPVTILNQAGDVLGEMSMINDVTSTATVTALTDCRFLVFNHKEILALADVDEGKHAGSLYLAFSQVLSNKLVNTNDKARRFERANTELKKVHREMDEVNQKRMEELASTKNLTSGLIKDLYEKDLAGLASELKDSEAELNSERLAHICERVEKARDQLRPLVEAFSSEMALEDKHVLLVEEDRKQQKIAKMALRGTGLDLDLVSTMDEAKEQLEQQSYDILLVCPSLIDVCEHAYKKNPDMRFVLMTSDEVSTYIQYFREHPFLTNVVSRNEEDRSFTVKNIFTTVGKLANDDIFGLSKYLTWGAEIQTEVVSGSAERPALIDKMAEQFEAIGVRIGVVERIRMVVEEMLMNAIYDAPVDSTGKAKYNHMQRTEEVVLEESEYGKFSFACDGIFAAVSVRDPFGSFKRDTLIRYLESCYTGNTGKEREFHRGKGGGGMGTHLMVETADLIVFNIHEGKRTEVIALFNVDKKAADQIKNPSFHLFYKT